MVPVQHVIGDSKSEWTVSKVFQKLWVRLLEVYDDIKGIEDGRGNNRLIVYL